MAQSGNLSIHVTNARGEVTHAKCDDLEFTKNARGGYQSASFNVPRLINREHASLTPLSLVQVDDARSGRRMWEGYLDIPGRNASQRAGHVWRVGAVGAASVLGDESKAYNVIDTDLTAWYRSSGNAGATTAASAHPDDDTIDALVLQFPAGIPIGNGAQVSMRYNRLQDAGQKLGMIRATHDEGVINTDYRVRFRVGPPGSDVLDMAFDTTTGTNNRNADTHFDVNQDNIVLRIARATGGATTVATDNIWCAFSDVVVRALLKDQAGANVLAATNTYVLAHEVITDALQWFTNKIDVTGASIDTSFTHQIDQLAYPDGIRMSDLLEDIALLEPDMTYGVFESNSVRQHRFMLGKYPTDVRYVVDTRDGWDSPGGEAALANSLRVYWTNKRGEEKSSVYTTDVPELDQWNRTRDAAEIRLGTEVGSQAAADRVGEAVLEQIANIPYAGKLTVARPIRDRMLGQSVMPWEIEPGYLVEVSDTNQPPMRLTEMTYRDSDGAAELTLGTPVYSTEELVNKLTRQRIRKGGALRSWDSVIYT